MMIEARRLYRAFIFIFLVCLGWIFWEPALSQIPTPAIAAVPQTESPPWHWSFDPVKLLIVAVSAYVGWTFRRFINRVDELIVEMRDIYKELGKVNKFLLALLMEHTKNHPDSKLGEELNHLINKEVG